MNQSDELRELLEAHHLDPMGDCHCGFEFDLLEDWLDHVTPLLAAARQAAESPGPVGLRKVLREHEWLPDEDSRHSECYCGHKSRTFDQWADHVVSMLAERSLENHNE